MCVDFISKKLEKRVKKNTYILMYLYRWFGWLALFSLFFLSSTFPLGSIWNISAVIVRPNPLRESAHMHK